MAAGLIGRALSTLELLAEEPEGLGVQELAERQEMALGSAHRLLQELIQFGYVCRANDNKRYILTTKLLALGFSRLSASGILASAQPVLDEVAKTSHELVRLAVADGARLTWVSKAQGSRSGLRYDPDDGHEALLFATASGHAWLAFIEEEEALQIVAAQGFGKAGDYGPNAPRSMAELATALRETRDRGYAMVIDSAAVGTSAVAVPVFNSPAKSVLGTLSVAGPSARLGVPQITNLVPVLLEAASQLSTACRLLGYFQSPLALTKE